MEANVIQCSNSKPSCVLRRRNERVLQNGSTEENGHGKKRREQDFRVSALLNFMPPAFAVLCYLNGLDGDFVHDDVYAIKDNADVTGKANISRLLVDDFWGRSMCDNASHKSYRPLTVLTFRLNYQLAGGTPWQFHAVNVALHALVTCLFSRLLRHVLHVQDVVTSAAALLFAVHPVHTEAVTGIVGRAELLSCVGVILSIICYASSLDHRDDLSGEKKADDERCLPRALRAVYLCVAMAASGLAMLCKEQGIMGLGLCAALDVLVFSRTVTRRAFRRLSTGQMDADDPLLPALCGRLVAVGCVGTGLMWFRLWMMCEQTPFFTEEDNPASFSPFLLTRVLTQNYLVAAHAWLLLCPRVLSYDWQVGSVPLLTSLQDVRNLATLLLYLFLALAGVRCLREFLMQDGDTKDAREDCDDDNNNNNNNNNTPVNRTTSTTTTSTTSTDTSKPKASSSSTEQRHVLLVGLTLLTLPFLPSSNLFFRVGFVMAERVLYIPSLGFCLLVAEGGVSLWHRFSHRRSHRHCRWCLILSATALCLLMAAQTIHRNQVWRTRETLFRSGIQTVPHNAKIHYNYANLLRDLGHDLQAEHHYRTAIRLFDKQPSYHNNLGTVLTDVKEAELCYRAALHLNPTHRGALVNLGNLLLNRNDTTGEQLLYQALAKSPDYIEALLSLSQLHLRRGQYGEAEEFVKMALRSHPDVPDLYHYYGIIFHQTGQYEAAVASYSRAVSLDAKFSHAMTNAAASLRQLGREHEAELFLKRAVEATEDRQAMEQLGQLYHRTGRTQEAVQVYTAMVHKAPNDTDLLLALVQTLMDNGQKRYAEKVVTDMLTRAPHNPQALYAKGHVHLALGQAQQALSAFLEASRWVENNTRLSGKILYEMGNVYKDMQMFPQALESYQAALAASPTLTLARHNLAVLYHVLGQLEQAQREYEHVLREEPTNRLLLENMAKLQRSLRARDQERQQPPAG
ncbi:protein O-mannosyl-transferase TMTC1-like [Babylonia areolata]|uniref:protein O-mannosyl-transferase TMTC1-like n=1 Tax=Babylonia areolata TaxID=304850 RepID=UPI003FCFD418